MWKFVCITYLYVSTFPLPQLLISLQLSSSLKYFRWNMWKFECITCVSTSRWSKEDHGFGKIVNTSRLSTCLRTIANKEISTSCSKVDFYPINLVFFFNALLNPFLALKPRFHVVWANCVLSWFMKVRLLGSLKKILPRVASDTSDFVPDIGNIVIYYRFTNGPAASTL